MNVTLLECAALYDTCESIRRDDPLRCGYCVSDPNLESDDDDDEDDDDDDEDDGSSRRRRRTFGYAIAISENRSCAARGGRTLINECAPQITSLAVSGEGTIHITGKHLSRLVEPRVRLCDEECAVAEQGDQM